MIRAARASGSQREPPLPSASLWFAARGTVWPCRVRRHCQADAPGVGGQWARVPRVWNMHQTWICDDYDEDGIQDDDGDSEDAEEAAEQAAREAELAAEAEQNKPDLMKPWTWASAISDAATFLVDVLQPPQNAEEGELDNALCFIGVHLKIDEERKWVSYIRVATVVRFCFDAGRIALGVYPQIQYASLGCQHLNVLCAGSL